VERVSSSGIAGDMAWLGGLLAREGLRNEIVAVGHRMVHGGSALQRPVWLDESTIAQLQHAVPLAPEHLPVELAAVDAVSRVVPGVRQAACFDTTFHRTLPPRARTFGIPHHLTTSGIVRYGFHGLSCESVIATIRSESPEPLPSRLVIAHLGSGSSLTAVRDGSSIDTSMGFTPAGGVVMGHRSGDVDPGMLLYLARERGFDLAALHRAVTLEGGLAGISGGWSDMRELGSRAPDHPLAALAIDVFGYQVRKMIGAYAAALEGLDLLVFTGGIGEHAAGVRETICAGLAWCGVSIDANRNARGDGVISLPGRATAVRVMSAKEEWMIARHVAALLEQSDSPSAAGGGA
jgi:acetate kinase